jgi:DNA invertase Pin-like site-specific DNA recombinase
MAEYISYVRVSTKEQGRSGLGLDAQRAVITHYCPNAIVKEYKEIESGTTMTRRPILEMAIAHAIRIGAILVIAKADRLSRDIGDAMAIVKRLKAGKTDLLSCDCPQSEMLAIFFFFAQREAEIISIRTKQALNVLKAQGKVLGKPKGKACHINSKRATIKSNRVRAVAENSHARAEALIHRKQGKSLFSTAEELNNRGIKTRRGNKWTIVSIARLIK